MKGHNREIIAVIGYSSIFPKVYHTNLNIPKSYTCILTSYERLLYFNVVQIQIKYFPLL